MERDELLGHAATLEQRDGAVARELAAVTALAERVDSVRSLATKTRARLEELPRDLEEVSLRRTDAHAGAERARARLAEASARLEELERARRRKEDEIDRARSEVATAQEELDDDLAQINRLDQREEQLEAERRELEASVSTLVRVAREIAAELRSLERVAEPASRDPGETLVELEDWASQARAALFVARGTLEGERDRIVSEAIALGEAVLGEALGGSSVALVRKRLEEHVA